MSETTDTCFWCEKCQKKFFITPDVLLEHPRSQIMKKPPFQDYEKIKDQKTTLKMEPQKKKHKCYVCGGILREVPKNVSGPNISS